MKNLNNLALSFIGCLLGMQCFAGEIQEIDGKLYVSPGSVYVAPEAIYVNVRGSFVAVDGVASDSNGIYIQDFESVMPGRRDERLFLCGICGYFHTLRQGCPK